MNKNKSTLKYGLILLLLCVGAFTTYHYVQKNGLKNSSKTIIGKVTMPGEENEEEEEAIEQSRRYDGMDKAIEFQQRRTRDLSTGKVPANGLLNAMLATEDNRRNTSLNRTDILSWIERGPNNNVVGPSGNSRPNGDVTSGRVRTIMVDSLDPTKKTVWVGSVSGGIWKTTDITVSPANWQLVSDQLPNLAIADMAQDPTNFNTMYAATGESYFNSDAVQGAGVFKSTNAGVTWSVLPSTVNYVSNTRILVDWQGNVYLATRDNGLLRSTDGGITWTNITPSNVSSSRICDMELSNPGGAGRLHIITGIFSNQTHRFTNSPSTVSPSSGWQSPATPFPSFNQRAEIACRGNTLYALPCNAAYQVPTIYKSTDGGNNWAATDGQISGNWASGQGWYSLSAGINPANPDECIVGGLDCFKTTDGGITWAKISTWVGSSGQYVHADQHDVTWYDNGNKLIFGCDGGIHYSDNKGTTIRDRNVGLRTKQFYSVAMHPTSPNYFLAGAQDNGVHQLTNAGLSGSTEVYGGDGAFCAIDQDEPQYQYGSYVYNVYRRSVNGGANWSSITFSASLGQFINPYAYDNLGNRIYACYGNGNYLRWNNPQTGNSSDIVSITAMNNAELAGVHVSTYTPNRIFIGTAAGRVVRVDDADQAAPTGTNITGAGMPGGYINSINTGSTEQNLVATYTNYGVTNVWVSSNGGTSWTGVDGNLPNMPVYWAIYNPDDNNKMYIATETGVWETEQLNGASTVWVANTSFPNVRTDMLQYRAINRTLAAGTHGRGVWSTTLPNACPPPTITTQPTSQAVCAGSNTSFTVATSSGATSQQWQVSTNGGGTFTNITNGGVYSGATTTTLSITGATLALNNYQYRCIITTTCVPVQSATSNAVTLTVANGISILTNPTSTVICAGSNTSFGTTASAAPNAYQWQVSTTGGASYTNVTNGGVYTGATTATLSITAATTTLTGYLYQCVLTTGCGTVTTTAATLTVNALTTITQNPVSITACAGSTASFATTATGSNLTYQWQVSTNGGGSYTNIGGALSATYSYTTAAADNNKMYRCIVTGACAPSATSTAATLTVNTPLVINNQPATTTVCQGSNATFSTTVTGTATYVWQVSTDGGATYTNITNGGVYSGATTTTLNITNATTTLNGYLYQCILTGGCGTVSTSAATLTVHTLPAITQSPASLIICAGNAATFSTTATGTAITYQWQVSTNGGGTFANIPLATAATYSFTGTLADNNNQYRCIVSGSCTPAATSTAATLTVNGALVINSQAASTIRCVGDNASFTVGVTGAVNNYQWQVSTNGGSTYTNLANGGQYANVNTTTLNITGITATLNGNLYRCAVTGSCPTLNSTGATLTVNTPPSITTQPAASITLCDGNSTTIATQATGTNVTYQWQLSTNGGTSFANITNGGNYSGATTSTLSVSNATIAMSNAQYRCVVNGTCLPSATSTVCTLVVNTPVSITTQPTNRTICSTGSTTFSIAATGTNPTYQWQVSTNNGLTFADVSGANSATLTLSNITVGMHNNLYRCTVIGSTPCGNTNSTAAQLSVSAQPTLNLTAAPYTKLWPGLTTVLTATTSLNPANVTYSWFKNNTLFTNNTNTYTVNVNNLGTYRVTVVDNTNGCTNTSSNVIIGDSVSTKLFIYPSPNNGQFTVAYYNSNTQPTTQSLTIFDAAGSLVYDKTFAVTQSYQLHQIDIRRNKSGLYYVVIGDKDRKKITVGEVLVNK